MIRLLFPLEAKKYGISWFQSVGLRQKEAAGREFIFKVFNYGAQSISGVRIRKKYNLGNHVRQVVNAIKLAQAIGAAYVHLPEDSPFEEGEIENVQLIKKFGENQNQARSELFGTFFYPTGDYKMGLVSNTSPILERLRKLMPMSNSNNIKQFDLVIHLRAGDVFSANPHPLYAPPPLLFFLEAIVRSEAKTVCLVTQSLQHPYISALGEWCVKKSIDLSIKNSNLLSDFTQLRNSKVLCVSQGTLAMSAAWLSSSCKSVFCYERNNDDIKVLLELGMSVHHALGVGYPKSWTGKVEELRLLSNPEYGKICWVSPVKLDS